MKPPVFLTFDLEEFDLPLEYGQAISLEKQLEVGKEGLLKVLKVLERQNVPATFFCTAVFAQAYPLLIKEIAQTHEIASHGWSHSVFNTADISASKQCLEEISGKVVQGFRMARLAAFDKKELVVSNYLYDSTLNPTWLPGRYNNFRSGRSPFLHDKLLVLPASVFGWFRFPLFWLSFKNIPFKLFSLFAVRELKKRKYLSLYFHPWEFSQLAQFKIPTYLKKEDGDKLTKKLERLIAALKQVGEFKKMCEYAA